VIAALAAVPWVVVLAWLGAILGDPFLTRHEYLTLPSPESGPQRPPPEDARALRQDQLRLPDGSVGPIWWVPTRTGALAWTWGDPVTVWSLPAGPRAFDLSALRPREVPAPRASATLAGRLFDSVATRDGAALLLVRPGESEIVIVAPDLSRRSVRFLRRHRGPGKDVALGPDGAGGLLHASWAQGAVTLRHLDSRGVLLAERTVPAPSPRYLEMYVFAGWSPIATVALMEDSGLTGRAMDFDEAKLAPRIPPAWLRGRKLAAEARDPWFVAVLSLGLLTAAVAWRTRARRGPALRRMAGRGRLLPGPSGRTRSSWR